MMILIIHHTSGLTWINLRAESIRISYTHFVRQVVCRSARSRQRKGFVARRPAQAGDSGRPEQRQ
ncbi:hypothetical protein C5T95_07135 [Raoultella ornithinolytica]|nr:hypothetical protein C5T95_07135 [Raoultella ornithinolytica]